jgi:flavin reductase (DIM6/NTAB) family NADH-FMN oxidoreductase RutF
MKKQSGLRLLEPFPLDRAFTFIESGPVVLVTTRHRRKKNVLTLSCHMSLGFEPLLGLTLGPWNHSLAALEETGECAVNIPASDMLETAIAIGNCSGSEVDKFQAFGLAVQKASLIRAPLLAGCWRSLECRVIDRIGKYNLFIVRGLKAWQNHGLKNPKTFHACGDGTFIIDGPLRDRRRQMTKWTDWI